MARIAYAILLVIFVSIKAFATDVPIEIGIDDATKREIVLRLAELKLAREKIALQQQYIERDKDQDRREAELADQRTALALQERDLWKEKAEQYKTAYESLTKGRSKGCWVAKIMTVGIARCH